MKILSILIFLFSTLSVSAQDSSWKRTRIDENLTISLPGKPLSIDTTIQKKGNTGSFRIIRATTEISNLGVSVTTNVVKLNVNDQVSLNKALEGIANGVCVSASEKNYTCKSYDTAINNVPGKKVLIYSGREDKPAFLYNYIFLINDKLYTITLSPFPNQSESVVMKELSTLLSTIQFNHTNTKEEKSQSKVESSSYKNIRLIKMI